MGGRKRGRMHDDYSTHAMQKFENEGKGELWNIVFIFYIFSDVRHSLSIRRLTHTVLKKL
jgi:hypothetical protein